MIEGRKEEEDESEVNMGYNIELELSRAHALRALGICRFLHRDRPVMLTISTSPAVGMVDRSGYDGRKKTPL